MVSDKTSAYERQLNRSRTRQARMSREGQDIGDIPAVVDPERRERCRPDLKLFLETYFPETFDLGWSTTHLEVIKKVQDAITDPGQLFALAMPRGSGKTSIVERALLWAVFYRHSKYPFVLAATDEKAVEILDTICGEIDGNDLLFEDFPEICYPISQLGGSALKAKGQHIGGEKTRITWKGKKRVLPTINGIPGAIFGVGGLTKAVRGSKYRTADGKTIRPDFVLIDDPQTDESATSSIQNEKLERIISQGVVMMAGPSSLLSAVMPCTVISPGDLADRMLNRETHPDWQGLRMAFLESMPTNLDKWEHYFDLRRDSFRAGHKPADADAYYLENQVELDAGAIASWPERHPGAATAIQYAMNVYCRDPMAFWAELQNDPLRAVAEDDLRVEAESLAYKISHYARGTAAPGCQWVTSFIDVHDRILYSMCVAWEPNYTGYIVDYRTWPKQPKSSFGVHTCKPTLSDLYPGQGLESSIYMGLTDLINELCSLSFPRLTAADGSADELAPLAITAMAIDSGYLPDVVAKAVRENPNRARILISKGLKRGPNEQPLSAWKPRVGEMARNEWIISSRRGARQLKFDTYPWKTFASRRLAAPLGTPGCVALPGLIGDSHKFLARHLTSEIRQSVEGERKVDVWIRRPGEAENHWFDCFVGCTVLADVLGVQLVTPQTPAQGPSRRRIRYA